MTPNNTTPPKVEVRTLDDLTPDPQNANKHTQRGHTLVENSLRRRGAFRSVAAAGKNTERPVVMAGNLTIEKARDAGITEVVMVHTTGNQLVAVVRDDLEPGSAEAIALGLEDNESAKQSYSPDIDLVAALAAADGGVLHALKQEDKVFGSMLERMGVKDETADAEPQIDRAAELLEKWHVTPGSLWRIGEHRLLCGDSTRREDVERVMQGEKAAMIFTDPPWNVDYTGGTKKREELANDDIEVGWDKWLTDALAIIPATDNAPAYVFFGLMRAGDTQRGIEDAGWRIVQTLVWVKQHAQFGNFRAHYKYQHEPMYYCSVGNKVPQFYGANNETSVWFHDRASRNDNHPTEKPVEVAEHGIRNSSQEGALVYDGFCGSGTTMVACENLGRKCRAIEISPAYCAVTLERMAQAFPGLPIERLNE